MRVPLIHIAPVRGGSAQAIHSERFTPMTPKASIERTSTGWPLRAVVHVALRGQPASAAHVKPIFYSFEAILTRFTLLEFAKIKNVVQLL